MGLLDWITNTTPGGQIGEAAQKTIGGIFDGVSTIIKEFHLSPEDEIKLKLSLAQLQLQTYQAQIADTQSARQMQIATRSVWPGLLTLIIMVGFFTALGIVIYHGLPALGAAGSEAILLLLGTLTTGFGMVLTFWFGSTMGSQNKDQMIWHSVPAPPPSTP
jgi:hypothetical protein